MNDNAQHGLGLNDPSQEAKQDGPVECLGKTFANDTERRGHYLTLLAEKLKDPEFRNIEGFPIGEDEDILNLSDPPYYTACPNPFIEDFIEHYGRLYDPDEGYKREPYATDVSEGKNDPIYNAHTYHTKVPHKAVMRYILHYTDPGDVVFDGFCGSGMAGIAAQLCGDRKTVESLGYRVLPNGDILEKKINSDKDEIWEKFSELGERNVVLNDLSPSASFIARNYNLKNDLYKFEEEANSFLQGLEAQCREIYLTSHVNGTSCPVNFTIWSDVFLCPECSSDVTFWNQAVDTSTAEVTDIFDCQNCGASIKKRTAERSFSYVLDVSTNETIKLAKQIPVLINYSYKGKRYEKDPDSKDMELLSIIDESDVDDWYPTFRMMEGKETRRNDSLGFTHVHHYYTKRNLKALALLYSRIKTHRMRFLFTAFVGGATKLNQFHLKNYVFGGGGVNPGARKGTLYAPSISMEVPIPSLMRDRLRTQLRAYSAYQYGEKDPGVLLTTGSCGNGFLREACKSKLDYIFIDPPFGANLNYSELSFFWESWLKVHTNNELEAIENSAQGKGAFEYRKLMVACFESAYEMLKPGRWMTVEFSNTKASVWNNIQTALTESGFIVANVSVLDKKQGGINANVTKTAVKQDLVISAYKPNGGFAERFKSETDEEGVWDFIRTHLSYLPVVKKQGGGLISVRERDPRILFDEVVAYFVKNHRDVPVSSKQFQEGLKERFADRDGMIFLPEQVSEYDKARITSSQLRQLSIFVDDEASAIEWIRQLLNEKPQSYQDIHPKFINELSGWKKAEEQLELSKLLEQNLLKYEGEGPVPTQINNYLTKNWHELRNVGRDSSELKKKAKDRWYVPNPEREEDLQKLRERDLLKQFDEYKEHTGRKLKTVRMEAVRCGFKKAWQERDYPTIISVAEKIPQNLLQEDQKLLMWYDQAQTRHSDKSLF